MILLAFFVAIVRGGASGAVFGGSFTAVGAFLGRGGIHLGIFLSVSFEIVEEQGCL
jgi:hypothetical protein